MALRVLLRAVAAAGVAPLEAGGHGQQVLAALGQARAPVGVAAGGRDRDLVPGAHGVLQERLRRLAHLFRAMQRREHVVEQQREGAAAQLGAARVGRDGRGRVLVERRRRLAPVVGLEADDLLRLAVLEHAELLARETGHGTAIAVQHDRVDRDDLDLGGEAGGLGAGRLGAGRQREPEVGQENRDHGCRLPPPMSERALLALFTLLKLALHVATSSGYGYFRDEFYYLACADHLAAGYVDHPPLSVFVLSAVRALLGDSRLALRLTPALLGAATVALVGLMARRLGGGRWAMALAMTGALVAPQYLALNHFYSMNAFDILFWALAAFAGDPARRAGDHRTLVRAGRRAGPGPAQQDQRALAGRGPLRGPARDADAPVAQDAGPLAGRSRSRRRSSRPTSSGRSRTAGPRASSSATRRPRRWSRWPRSPS